MNEHQFHQDPNTIDESDLFTTHMPTNTLGNDQQIDDKLYHDIENPQEIMIQLQPETSAPPLTPIPGIPVPAPLSVPLENPLTLRQDAPSNRTNDDPASLEYDPPQVERETNPLNPHPEYVPSQQPSQPADDASDHEPEEQDHARTHAVPYNSRENPKPRTYYVTLEQSNEPALGKFLLGKTHKKL